MKTFEEIKSELNARWTGFTVKVKVKVRETYQWCCEHRDETAFIVTTGIGAIGAITKLGRRIDHKLDLKKEQDLKDLYVYDRSLGIYHELRRKLKPSEAMEIDRRRANGESMVHILNNMRLLK